MSARLPSASDESSILRDVRWGLIEPERAVDILMARGWDKLVACDAVCDVMANMEHRL